MINSLQSLRGIFAIMIFLHHFPINGEGMFEAGGPCGVAFFLILSGFVMCAGYEKKAEQTKFEFSRYYLKRIIRVYPLHFLCLAIFLALHIWNLSMNGILGLLPNLLLLQSWIPIQSIYFSGNAVSWCLCDLMFFYAIFPIIIQIINKFKKVFWYSLSAILILYFSCVHLIPGNLQHALIYINPLFRLVDFTLGIALWQIWIELRKSDITDSSLKWNIFSKSVVEASALGMVTCAIIAYPYCYSWVNLTSLWWLPCLCLIYVFTLFNKRGGILTKCMNWKPLVVFGDFSFSFYMIHQLFISIILRILNKFHITLDPYLMLAMTLALVIGAAWVIYTYFEKPISKFLLQKFGFVK